MRTITIWLMILNLKIAERKMSKEKNSIIKHAYEYAVNNYKNTIVYLKAQRHSSFVAFKNFFSK